MHDVRVKMEKKRKHKYENSVAATNFFGSVHAASSDRETASISLSLSFFFLSVFSLASFTLADLIAPRTEFPRMNKHQRFNESFRYRPLSLSLFILELNLENYDSNLKIEKSIRADKHSKDNQQNSQTKHNARRCTSDDHPEDKTNVTWFLRSFRFLPLIRSEINEFRTGAWGEGGGPLF